MTEPRALRIEDLTVRLAGRPAPVLEGVTLRVGPGERVGIVGPSGAGKTMTLLSVLGLLPQGATATGRILWGDEDLLRLPVRRLRQIRGGEIGLVFQAPSTALHPLHRVDRQVAEALEVHASKSPDRTALARARQALTGVGLEPAADGGWPFPHEMSGGQRQRVMVAMAMVNEPALLLADEPTTWLDMTVQARVLALVESQRRRVGAGLLLVSHDLEVVAEVTDRVVLMEGGRVTAEERARHVSGHGTPAPPRASPPMSRPPGPSGAEEPVLGVEDLHVTYRRPRPFRRPVVHRAVEGLTLDIRSGETLGLVGESGAGKSTLARAVMRLQSPSGGRILLRGRDLWALHGRELRAERRGIQIVFQDPAASLNPRRAVGAQIADPLRRLGGAGGADPGSTVVELLERVGLRPDHARRLPHELSTGEQQRVCIARALGPGPEVLVLDEPVSALDRQNRSRVLDLLLALQEERSLAFLFITHDLRVVARMAHRVAVMHRGRMVEEGPAERVLGSPEHPSTRELIAAIPRGSGGPILAQLPPSPASWCGGSPSIEKDSPGMEPPPHP